MESSPDAILPILVQLGCPGLASLKSVSQFDTQQLVSAVIVLLQVISPDASSFPKQLPRANAARFRLCSDLAQRIQALGYPSDVGYQAFLYPNAQETRSLLVFLLDKLPRNNSEADSLANAREVTMSSRIAKACESLGNKRKLWRPQTPPHHHSQVLVPLSLPFVPGGKSAETREFSWYVKEVQKSGSSQTRPIFFPCSLLNQLDEDLVKQQDLENSLLRAEEKAAAKIRLNHTLENAFKAAQEALTNSSKANLSLGEIFESYKGYVISEGSGFPNSAFGRRKIFEEEVKLTHIDLVGSNGVITKVSLVDGQKAVVDAKSTEDELLELQRVRRVLIVCN
jgi:hypothetical protein